MDAGGWTIDRFRSSGGRAIDLHHGWPYLQHAGAARPPLTLVDVYECYVCWILCVGIALGHPGSGRVLCVRLAVADGSIFPDSISTRSTVGEGILANSLADNLDKPY